jgi:hypothetical protein
MLSPADALPFVVTHGWPGLDERATEDHRTADNPTKHGGSASDAFIS